MGMDLHDKVSKVDVNVTDKEIEQNKAAFQHFDIDNNGSISFSNLRKVLRDEGETISDDYLRELMNEVSTKNSTTIELNEFLQVNVGSSTLFKWLHDLH